MFITQAFAQTADAAATTDTASMFSSMLPLLLILVVFYAIVIRPQNKRAQQHSLMISNLKKGDKVVTSGGMIGKIKKIINDKEVSLEIADNVEITIMRSSVVSLKNLDDVNAKV